MKIPMILLQKYKKNYPKIHIKSQGTPNSKSKLEKEEQNWRTYTPDLITYYQAKSKECGIDIKTGIKTNGIE